MRSVATSYIDSGYLPIPIPLTTKAPLLKNWTTVRVTEDNVGEYFDREESNIGILLGAQENPVADIDCDCTEAITAAACLLPATPALFGREGAPRSHYLYRIDNTVESKRFTNPMADGDESTLVELRCAKKNGTVGLQTVVPPSIHPSGERVKWDGNDEFPAQLPQPATVSAAALQTAVARVAAVALLARYWVKPGEGRHKAMLALAGVLARENWNESEALTFCNALYRSIDAPDTSKFDRVQSEVHSTFEKHSRNENVTGLDTLKKLVNERAVTKALQWLRDESEPSAVAKSDNRPEIQMRNRGLEEKTADCIEVLKAANEPPTLFFRCGTLVCLRTTAAEDAFSILEVTEPILSSILSQKAIFLKGHERTDPSERVMRNVLVTLSESKFFPPLEGVVTAPVIRGDGSILDTPGYDPVSRLYYAPARGLTVPTVPEEPTAEDVKKAVEVVEDVICDFPFDDESSKANALAALLTPIVRPAIEGPTPLALFDATAAGTGKTLLAEIVSIIATGTDAAMMTVPKQRDEWRKKITSVLRSNPAVVVFDNVSNRLDADELMTALSGESWSDRILGQSQQITIPIRCAWIVTANNVQLERQMIRRSYLVRMNAKCAKPEERNEFRHSNIKQYVKSQRGNLLAALLTFARAWFVNGRQAPGLKPLGGFESWANVIGGILQTAEIQGFLNNRDQLSQRSDDETQSWETLLSQLATVFKGKAFTTADILLQMKHDLNSDLKESMDVIFCDAVSHEPTLKQRIAKSFKERLERRYGDDNGKQYWIETKGTKHRLARWVVCSNPSLTVVPMSKRVAQRADGKDAA